MFKVLFSNLPYQHGFLMFHMLKVKVKIPEKRVRELGKVETEGGDDWCGGGVVACGE